MRPLLAASRLLLASPAFADTTAITNARIHTMGRAGEIASGTMVMRNGRIVAASARTCACPAGATIVDAKGRTVTPGLFIPGTNLGAIEIDLGQPNERHRDEERGPQRRLRHPIRHRPAIDRHPRCAHDAA